MRHDIVIRRYTSQRAPNAMSSWLLSKSMFGSSICWLKANNEYSNGVISRQGHAKQIENQMSMRSIFQSFLFALLEIFLAVKITIM